MLCCLKLKPYPSEDKKEKHLLTNFMTGGHYCLTAERFTHAQRVNLKIDVMHWFHFF